MSSEIIKKVRALMLQSRTPLSGIRSGFFKTKNAGSGYDFDQLVEYYQGGDVRRIDWKSSARSNTLLLREYKDEQQRTVHLIADTSVSLQYGSQQMLLSQVRDELCKAFETIAHHTGDQVIDHSKESDHSFVLSEKLRFFVQNYKKRCLVIIISDFIDQNYEQALSVAAHQHEVIAVRLRDVNEAQVMHAFDYIMCQDSERTDVTLNGNVIPFDGDRWRLQQAHFFKKLPIAWFDCYNDTRHIEALAAFIMKYS